MKALSMKLLKKIKIALILVLICAGAWYCYLQVKTLGMAKNVKREGVVQRMDLIQRVTIAGNVRPERKTIVTAPFNGYIKKLYVKIGQKINKNDPIVSIVQSLQSVDPIFPLRAPFEGTVVSIRKYEGEFVKRDDPKDFILRIDSLKNLYIISNVPEIDSVKIKIGQEVIIKASAIIDKKYKGWLQ